MHGVGVMINRRDLLLLGSLGLVESCIAKAGDKVVAVDHELKLLAGLPRSKYLVLPKQMPRIDKAQGDYVLTETFPHHNGGYTKVQVRIPYRFKVHDELKAPLFKELVKADIRESNYPHFHVESLRSPYSAVISLTGFDKGATGLVHRIKVESKKRVGLLSSKSKNLEFYSCQSESDSDICRVVNPEEGEVGYVEKIGYLTHTRPAKGKDKNTLLKLFKAVKEFYEPRLAVLMTREHGVVVGERKTTRADVKRLDEMLYMAARV